METTQESTYTRLDRLNFNPNILIQRPGPVHTHHRFTITYRYLRCLHLLAGHHRFRSLESSSPPLFLSFVRFASFPFIYIRRNSFPSRSALASFMSKRRGLSLEEKREHMLQIFYDSQGFFLLKELEKLGPKKGVISQSVKDVVQSLVDDDLVLKDKIGTSVYFWSLPSCAGNQLRNAHNKLESDLLSRTKHLAELEEQRVSLKRGREESDDREMALEELKTVELQHKKLKDEVALFADNDPAAVEAMKAAIEVAHSAANRWTDNIFTLQHWCSSNFPEAKEQLEHMYKEVGITEELDYL